MPALFHHYFELCKENHNLTFFDFLSEHYSNHQIHHHHDEDLPFKTGDCSLAHLSVDLIVNNPFSIIEPFVFHEKSSPIPITIIYSPTLFHNIWQPPKIS